MTKIIEALREEHRNIDKLLSVLERELLVFDRGERPDYHIVHSVIRYFQGFPDSCHHPKEDMVLAKLKARNPIAAARVRDLEIEHKKGSIRLGRVARAVDKILIDDPISRSAVDEIIHDFIDHERDHMEMEERLLFPTALEVLEPSDWNDIKEKWSNKADPLSDTCLEGKYHILRKLILKWEEEAELGRLPQNSEATSAS